MAKCPKCSAPISLEIEQYGGTCPNCFAELEGSIGEDCPEFEPTGMFTPDQFQSSVEQAETGKDEFTEELLTDEVDLDDVLVFEDEITEPLEVTEPIVKETNSSDTNPSNLESAKETTVEVVEVVEVVETLEKEDEAFDFEDEPTMALNSPLEISPNEETSRGEGVVAPAISVAGPTQNTSFHDDQKHDDQKHDDQKHDAQDVEIVEIEDPDFDSLPTGEDKDEGVVFDEDSIEEFLVDDIDGVGVEGVDDIGISPMSEKMGSSDGARRPTTKRQHRSIDWKPIVGTILVIGMAALAIFPKDEEVTAVSDEPVEETFVPEIKTGTVDKREPVLQSGSKPKQTKKSKKPKAKVVEVGGVSTFQTAKPVRTSRAPISSKASTSKSALLERDVNKLKKSLKYCHTKALKNDPTVAGKWEVQFRVTGGKASNVKIKAMRSVNSEIESCMKTKIQRFGFTDGLTQNFKFRILFER